MLHGNKISIWNDNSLFEEFDDLEVGDYVFIWLDDYGIIGAGEIISEKNYNNYSIVEVFIDEEKKETEYQVVEECYINIKYDRIGLNKNMNDSNLESLISIGELENTLDILIKNANKKQKKYFYFERKRDQINDFIEKGEPVTYLSLIIAKELNKKILND